MSNTDQSTPATKAGRRGRKAAQRNPKPVQSQGPQADQLQASAEPIGVTAAPAGTAPIESAAADTAPIDATSDAAATAADVPADPAPISLQTIANAYGDYTRRSFEETRSFVERLKGVRSLDKAMEVQTEFATHAYEMFVAESQKIYGLHKELARQSLKPLEGFVTKSTRDAG